MSEQPRELPGDSGLSHLLGPRHTQDPPAAQAVGGDMALSSSNFCHATLGLSEPRPPHLSEGTLFRFFFPEWRATRPRPQGWMGQHSSTDPYKYQHSLTPTVSQLPCGQLTGPPKWEAPQEGQRERSALPTPPLRPHSSPFRELGRPTLPAPPEQGTTRKPL